jgi:hypothetical protein
VDSSLDEGAVLAALCTRFGDRVRVPPSRMWYDFLLRDAVHGWLPVNIKTTTTETRDNVGNLAMCVYAYTDAVMPLDRRYANGAMSVLLLRQLAERRLTHARKRDYYFVVVNKRDPRDVIVNSLKGLSRLSANVHNLPFQVCWRHNREFAYARVEKCVETFLACMRTLRVGWRETFVESCRAV